MKLIIAGSRGYDPGSIEEFERVVRQHVDLDKVTHIVHGMCPKGADYWANELGKHLNIPMRTFPAIWRVKKGNSELFDKGAGMKRNRHMAVEGDALLSFWDGTSNGTANMNGHMKRLKKPYTIVRYLEERTSCTGLDKFVN